MLLYNGLLVKISSITFLIINSNSIKSRVSQLEEGLAAAQLGQGQAVTCAAGHAAN